MAGGPTRSDTYSVQVAIEHPTNGNMINYGIFDKMTGGEVDSDNSNYYPGGMSPPVSLGGRRSVGNVVVSRLYRLGRDHDVVGQLIDSAGKSSMIVTKQPLDVDGNVYGRPIVYKGTMKRVTAPEVDSEASAAGILEIVFIQQIVTVPVVVASAPTRRHAEIANVSCNQHFRC